MVSSFVHMSYKEQYKMIFLNNTAAHIIFFARPWSKKIKTTTTIYATINHLHMFNFFTPFNFLFLKHPVVAAKKNKSLLLFSLFIFKINLISKKTTLVIYSWMSFSQHSRVTENIKYGIVTICKLATNHTNIEKLSFWGLYERGKFDFKSLDAMVWNMMLFCLLKNSNTECRISIAFVLKNRYEYINF